MSFALNYRKKMQADARKARAKKTAAAKADTGFVVSQPKKNTDTRSNRRRVLASLSLAGIILSVFNSGAMVNYAGGLGYNDFSMKVILATESWHRLMEDHRMTFFVEGVREAVMTARQSSWQDLAFGVSLKPTHPYLQAPDETARPASEEPVEQQKPEPLQPDEEPAPLQGPVMKAAIGR